MLIALLLLLQSDWETDAQVAEKALREMPRLWKKLLEGKHRVC